MKLISENESNAGIGQAEKGTFFNENIRRGLVFRK